MKKFLLVVFIIIISILSYRYFQKNELRKDVIAFGVELKCWEKENRMDVPMMRADGKSSEEIQEGIRLVENKMNEVSKKYGYESHRDFSVNTSKKFSQEEQNEIEKKVFLKAKEECGYSKTY